MRCIVDPVQKIADDQATVPVPPPPTRRRARPDRDRFKTDVTSDPEEAWLRRARIPVYVSMGLASVVVVMVPLSLGLYFLAVQGCVIIAVLALSLRAITSGAVAFRRMSHLVYFLCLTSLSYCVFWLGLPPVITVYFPAIMLLAAAELIGTRAALGWSVPSLLLVAAGAFAPPAQRFELTPEVVFIVRAATLLTILGLAVSFRRWRDQQSARLQLRATTDPLTGLPNRRALDQALFETLQRSARFGRQGALALIDLDGVKQVNDELGHEAGDQLLRIVATRLAASTREVDTAARIGGDEFVVLLSEYQMTEGAETFAGRLLQSISTPCKIGGEIIEPSASIGIALFPDGAINPRDLLQLADEAMYEAKRAGGGQIAWITTAARP